jgi:hypothetical protein
MLHACENPIVYATIVELIAAKVEMIVMVAVEVLGWFIVGDKELPAEWICILITLTMTW